VAEDKISVAFRSCAHLCLGGLLVVQVNHTPILDQENENIFLLEEFGDKSPV